MFIMNIEKIDLQHCYISHVLLIFAFLVFQIKLLPLFKPLTGLYILFVHSLPHLFSS